MKELMNLRFTFLLTVLMLIGMPETQAQHTYIPFPDSNAIWVVEAFDEFGRSKGGYQYFIDRDTVINDTSYHMVYFTVDSNLQNVQWNWKGIRNDTVARKVHVYDNSSDKEWLLYDFSLKVGDTIGLDSWGSNFRYTGSVIKNIDTISLHGKDHLVFYPQYGMQPRAPYIEGIGSVAGLFETTLFFEGGFELVCLITGEDRQPYYTYGNHTCQLYHYTGITDNQNTKTTVSIYPSPVLTHSLMEISGQDQLVFLEVYDITGSLVYQWHGQENRIIIGKHITQNGMYFYRGGSLQDRFFSGKFLK